MTPWPIDKQYPDPTPRRGDTVTVRTTLTAAGPDVSRTSPAGARVQPRLPWVLILALTAGLLSAFLSGVAIVWAWGRFVVACS